MPLNRREWIAAALGLPVLMSGCDSPAPSPPAGELYGQNFAIGHRLRTGWRPQPAAQAWQSVDVVIVGAGAAGLAAARRLEQSGISNFVVLELEDVPGGTARSGACPTSPFPWGAHYIPVPLAHNRDLITLLQEMGVVEAIEADGTPRILEQVLCREPEERLFFEGQWIENLNPEQNATAKDLAQWQAFRREMDRWSQWRDDRGRPAFTIPTRHCSDAQELARLDSISMGDWLRQQGWTSPRLHWFVDYSCRDDYGLSVEQTSAWAGLLYFVGRMRGPGAEPQPLMTWPNGNGHVIQHMASRLGARLRTGFAVTQISNPADTQASVEVTGVEIQTDTARGFRARSVIFAAPQYLATRLVEGISDRNSNDKPAFEYGSWIVANLQLRARPREASFPLSWDNVIHDSRSLGYVVATHQSGQDYGPTVWTWYYPYVDGAVRGLREALLAASWADLAELVLSDLERPHPEIRHLVDRLDIFRWGHAMVCPRPGFRFSQARRNAASPRGRVHFANTDLSGIALFEEAFDHGCQAADAVAAALREPGSF